MSVLPLATARRNGPGCRAPVLQTYTRARAASLRTIHFPENCPVYKEGDTANVMYTVTAGVMRACHYLADGRRQITAFYRAGDLFGLDLTKHRSHTVEAVCIASAEPHWDRSPGPAGTQNTILANTTLRAIMASLNGAVSHNILLGRCTAREKLSSFLLDWFDGSSGERLVELPMTREDIGDYLGMTPETVSRQFAALQSLGLISVLTPRRVLLDRPNDLRALLG